MIYGIIKHFIEFASPLRELRTRQGLTKRRHPIILWRSISQLLI